MSELSKRISPQEAIDRFDTEDAAREYALAHHGTATHRREEQCISRILSGVPRGAALLDLPCGAGRMLPLLVGLGFEVTAVDSSDHMIREASQYAGAMNLGLGGGAFRVASVFETGFADGEFDVVVCSRLFHHFPDLQDRRDALRELGRICTGPIIVSYFRDLGWDALSFRIKNLVRPRKSADRIPISFATLKKDIEAAGLVATRTLGVRPFISKQWYVVLRRRPASLREVTANETR